MKKTESLAVITPALSPIPHSAEGLRDALFDEINLLRANKNTTSRARAISSLARQIIEGARVGLQHQKLSQKVIDK